MSTNTQQPVRPTDVQTKHDPTWITEGEVIHVKRAESELPIWAKENTTDYDYPEDFWNDEKWTDVERARWMTRRRNYEMVKRQWQAGTHEVSEARARACQTHQSNTDGVDPENYR